MLLILLGDLEERIIGSSIHSTISPSVYSANMPQYKRLLERFFPQIWKKIGGYADRFRNTPLLYSVKQQLMSDILYAKEEFVLKVRVYNTPYICIYNRTCPMLTKLEKERIIRDIQS